jgi:hypothetical protein
MGGSALSGKRAVVTGSTRGLGFAFARELAEQGASVVINGRDAVTCADAEAQLSAIGAAVASVPGSVADEQVAEQLVATCVDRFGRRAGVPLRTRRSFVVPRRPRSSVAPEQRRQVLIGPGHTPRPRHLAVLWRVEHVQLPHRWQPLEPRIRRPLDRGHPRRPPYDPTRSAHTVRCASSAARCPLPGTGKWRERHATQPAKPVSRTWAAGRGICASRIREPRLRLPLRHGPGCARRRARA